MVCLLQSTRLIYYVETPYNLNSQVFEELRNQSVDGSPMMYYMLYTRLDEYDYTMPVFQVNKEN